MQNQLRNIAAGLLVIASGAASWAGGCELTNVTLSKKFAAKYLAELVDNKVVEIDKAMKARGQELTMVIVARKGESLDGLRPYADDPNVPLPQFLNQLAKAMHEVPQDQQDKLFSPTKLKYSHMGFLYKQTVNAKDLPPGQISPNWFFITHLLANCDPKSNKYGKSSIHFDEFDHFFWDTQVLSTKQYADSVEIIVPSPEFQKAVAAIIDDKKAGQQIGALLHEPKYNVAAVPFRIRDDNDKKSPAINDYHQASDQNSNQWPLEVMAAAEVPYGQIMGRFYAQDQLWKTNYRPSILKPVGLKESLACSVSVGHLFQWEIWNVSNLITCNDQYFRGDGIVQLITVNSLIDYLTRMNLLADSVDQPGKVAVYEVAADPKKIEELDQMGQRDQKLYDHITGADQKDGQSAGQKPAN